MALTHIDTDNRPGMVDVSGKKPTRRTATARAVVALPEAVRPHLSAGDIRSAKGPVFQTAVIAGTMAVKNTSALIPLCHPVPIDGCKLNVRLNEAQDTVIIDCTVTTEHKTGVEMEALTGAGVAALTVYDMLKAVSHDIVIRSIELLHKSGGKREVDRQPAE